MPKSLEQFKARALDAFNYGKEQFAKFQKQDYQVLREGFLEVLEAKEALREKNSQRLKAIFIEDSDPQHNTREDSNALLRLKYGLLEPGHKMIESFDAFFISLDKLFAINLEDSSLETEFQETLEEASGHLGKLETILFSKEVAMFKGQDLFDPFVSIFHNLHKNFIPFYRENFNDSALEGIVRPRLRDIDLIWSQSDPYRDKERPAPAKSYMDFLKVYLVAYLNSDTPKETFNTTGLEPQRLPPVFREIQRELFIQIADADYEEIIAKFNLKQSPFELREIIDSPVKYSKFIDDKVSGLLNKSYPELEKEIREILLFDTMALIRKLRDSDVEINQENFDKRILLKTEPKRADFVAKAPSVLNTMIGYAGYSGLSISTLRGAMGEYVREFDLGNEFYKSIDLTLYEMFKELDYRGNFSWVHSNDITSVIDEFTLNARKEIFKPINSQYYKEHGSDLESAMNNIFKDYDLRAFKKTMREIIGLALKKGVDEQKLFKFVYLASQFFQQNTINNGRNTIKSRLSRRLKETVNKIPAVSPSTLWSKFAQRH